MSVPAGYKATEVGVIPEDWDAKPLKSLNPFITSGSRGWAKYYADVGDAFVRITNLSRQNIYPDIADLRRVKLPAGENEGTRTGLRNGDVLVSITADIGIIGYVDDRVPKPAYINQHIATVRVDPSDADSKFLSYFLATEGSQRRVRATTDAGAKAGMSLSGVGNLLVACPPTVSEQAAIAKALSDMDEAIAAVEAVIAKKRALKTATMQALLSGTRRLPGFSGEWDSKPLAEVTECLDRVRVPLNEAQRSRMKGPIPYCGANGVVGHVNDFIIDDDVILIAEDGGYFDEFATRPIAYRMSGKIWVNNHAHIIQAKTDTDQNFLFWQLVHKDITPNIASGTRAKLNRSELDKIECEFPKRIEEQSAIAEVLDDIASDIECSESQLIKLHDFKAGMMQQLLTGKIRLI